VTLLFPFVPREDLGEGVLRSLERFFDVRAPFTLTLVELGTFPDAVYAVPEPWDQLRRWIVSLSERFPEYPPYGGEFVDVVPHATLGIRNDPRSRKTWLPELER
jgi:2'-5' RNA ligase superfamily